MKYETVDGFYVDALQLLLENGGQLFSGKNPGSPSTVVRGRHCKTFWEPNSSHRGKVVRLAMDLGLDPEHMTGGRLARRFLEDVLTLPTKGTYFGREFQQLARSGQHWHYTHIVTGDAGDCIELDLRSAYLTALLKGKTLLYDRYSGFLDDDGALDALRHCLPFLEEHKWFRLVLLGVMASHQKNFFSRSFDDKHGAIAVPKCISHIAYGAAFNAVHGAILRVFNLMKQLHTVAGEYCVRCHTDSLTIKHSIPPHKLSIIGSIVAKGGYELTVKGEGRTHFFDLNSGFIGKKLIGNPVSLKEYLSASEVKIPRDLTSSKLDLPWHKTVRADRIDPNWQP